MNNNLKEGLEGVKEVGLYTGKGFLGSIGIVSSAMFGASIVACFAGGNIESIIPTALNITTTISCAVASIIAVFKGSNVGFCEPYNSKAKKVGAVLAGAILTTTTGCIAKAGFNSYEEEVKNNFQRIKAENTVKFNDELEVSGTFNKVTNTYTIENVASESLPKGTKIQFKLDNR